MGFGSIRTSEIRQRENRARRDTNWDVLILINYIHLLHRIRLGRCTQRRNSVLAAFHRYVESEKAFASANTQYYGNYILHYPGTPALGHSGTTLLFFVTPTKWLQTIVMQMKTKSNLSHNGSGVNAFDARSNRGAARYRFPVISAEKNTRPNTKKKKKSKRETADSWL